MANKWVYLFSEGNANMRELLGGKGANLAEMTGLGLPVPQGFTITTEACTQYYEDGREINDEIQGQINEYIVKMEEITGKKFGDKENPLLVSVRSGARASMPGMMDTILNLGLNETVVEAIAAKSGNARWAWDFYRRFIQMYSDVVMEVGKKYFEELIDKMKADRGVKQDVELTADDLKELAAQFKAEYKEKIGEDFPDDPKEQLMGAIKAVFRSWDNPRANVYRRDNDIPYSWGTAVNVQSMAFGNMGDDCGTEYYTEQGGYREVRCLQGNGWKAQFCPGHAGQGKQWFRHERHPQQRWLLYLCEGDCEGRILCGSRRGREGSSPPGCELPQ